VLLSPHIGGSTEEAQEAIGREVSHSLTQFMITGATTSAVNFPKVELPPLKGTHRILNVHRNVPGVLRDVNRIVSDLNANIDSQVLSTDATIGYLIMDLSQDVSTEVSRRIAALDKNIRTRVLY
jgi:D-3-phosphoglycerate dehydrogenase